MGVWLWRQRLEEVGGREGDGDSRMNINNPTLMMMLRNYNYSYPRFKREVDKYLTQKHDFTYVKHHLEFVKSINVQPEARKCTLLNSWYTVTDRPIHCVNTDISFIFALVNPGIRELCLGAHDYCPAYISKDVPIYVQMYLYKEIQHNNPYYTSIYLIE